MSATPTDALIREMASEAGGQPPRRSLRPGPALALAIAAGLLGAAILVLLVAGPRPELARMAARWIVQFKMVAAVLAAAGAATLVFAAMVPGRTLRPGLALLPVCVFLLGELLFDPTRFPILGRHATAAPHCTATIVLAALPALAAVLLGMRAGIPTRPTVAGACAGLLAGSLGALAYTIACLNDGARFVILWYGTALLITTAIGAWAGRRLLTW